MSAPLPPGLPARAAQHGPSISVGNLESLGFLVEHPSFEPKIIQAGVKFVSAFPVGTWLPLPSPSTP